MRQTRCCALAAEERCESSLLSKITRSSTTPDYPAGTPDGSRGEAGVFLRGLLAAFPLFMG